MFIDKAIEILKDPDLYLKLVLEDDQMDAVRLGTEALKTVKEYRQRGIINLAPLPGETQE